MLRLSLLIVLLAASLGRSSAAVASAPWRAPVAGPIVQGFTYDVARPYAGGVRRGVAFAARAATPVRAACTGRVTFAGRLPADGRGVTVRCGLLAATHLGLAELAVARGRAVVVGAVLGRAAGSGVVRLGARRVGDRHGYVDPRSLLGGATVEPPAVAPPPRRRPPAPRKPAPSGPAAAPLPSPAVAPSRGAVPVVGWAGLALVASGACAGATVRARRRRRAALGVAPVAR